MARGDFTKREFFPKKELFPNRPDLFPKKDAPVVAKTAKAEKVTKTQKPSKTVKSKEKKATVIPPARFELCTLDEYGQTNIVFSNSDLNKVIERARQYVTEANTENALAEDDRIRNWVAYFPVVKDDPTILYAGNRRNGTHQVWTIENDKWELKPIPAGTDFRFYLGSVLKGRTKEDWFLQNHLKKEISSFKDTVLDAKTSLFIKAINK